MNLKHFTHLEKGPYKIKSTLNAIPINFALTKFFIGLDSVFNF